MEISELLGSRIRTLRKARHLTQQQLAEHAGLNYKYVGAVERGEENPSLKVLAAIANGLGIELRDLFELEHEEVSGPKLRKKLDQLLKDANTATLQQAVKLFRALVT